MRSLTPDQELRIKSYLDGKQLPAPLFQEIEEHFVSQIITYQNDENLNFETSFLKAKESWKRDFRLQRSFLTNFRKKPAIVVRYIEDQQMGIFKFAFGVGMFQIVIQLGLALLCNRDSFVFRSLIMFVILDVLLPVLVVLLFLGFKIKNLLMNFQNKSVPTTFRISYALMLVYFFTRFFYLPSNQFILVYDYVHEGRFGFSYFIWAQMSTLMATTTYSYLFINFWKRLNVQLRSAF